MKKSFFILSIISIFSICSCSLKYRETPNVDDIIPEFIFENTKMTSYEKNTKKMEVKSQIVEQYKNSSQSFAKDVEFLSYDDKSELLNEGNCGYLFADSKNEIYQLYDDISLYNHTDNIKFSADVLKWNGKTEQLTSGKSDSVKVEKDNTVIIGSGFSASGVSKSYKFTGAVSGTITDSESFEEK